MKPETAPHEPRDGAVTCQRRTHQQGAEKALLAADERG